MLDGLILQDPFGGCSIVGSANSFCPEDIWNYGLPILLVLLLSATALSLYKAWRVSQKNEDKKKRLQRIIMTIGILANAYVLIAYVPAFYNWPYSFLVIVILGTFAMMSVYRTQKGRAREQNFDKSPVHFRND